MGQEQVVSEESLEREDAFLFPVPVPSPWAQFIQQSCFKHRSDARLGPSTRDTVTISPRPHPQADTGCRSCWEPQGACTGALREWSLGASE